MERTRTYSWRDPAEIAALARGKSGLELLQALVGDDSAPITQTLGFRLAEAELGRVVFELTPSEFQQNPMGTVHGGVACTLLDSAMGAAVHSRLEVAQAYTTLELKVNLTRAITAGSGVLRAEGTVVSFGSRVATSQAFLRDAAGKLYAHGTSTCLILTP